MLSALFYLQTRSFWNSLVVRVKRLRQPKYLAGAIVGVAWFGWTFGGPFFLRALGPRRHGRMGQDPWQLLNLGPDSAQIFEGFAALVLAGWVLFTWILPNSRAALQFSEAEIAFLFPSPVRRRGLVHYKLLRWQLGLLLTSVIFSFVTGRFTRDGHWLLHLAGWWMTLFTLNLHGLAASFTMTRWLDRG